MRLFVTAADSGRMPCPLNRRFFVWFSVSVHEGEERLATSFVICCSCNAAIFRG